MSDHAGEEVPFEPQPGRRAVRDVVSRSALAGEGRIVAEDRSGQALAKLVPALKPGGVVVC